MPADPRDPHSGESQAQRDDRNLGELLQELRVAGLGVQVLFGFLLSLPFTTRFARLSGGQRDLYLACLVLAAVATALLLGPVAYHRMVFRQGLKESLVRAASVMASAGLVAVGLAVSAAVLLVTWYVAGGPAAVVIAAFVACVFTGLWFGFPLARRREREREPSLSNFRGDSQMAAMRTETVAVLGAGGTMGYPIARNIARAGIPVRAWNRSRDKAEPLAGDGAYIADTPADAAYGAGIVITMLADEDTVLGSMQGPDGALRVMPHAVDRSLNASDEPIWLQMSTIGVAATRRCAELANRAGVGFVDAPVLGSREPAEQRKLVILESGPEEARPRVRQVFDAIAHRVIRAGEAGAGSRLKLVANSWVVAVVEAGAETIALAEGLGLDPSLFFTAIEGGALDLPYLRMKGTKIAERDFTPAFRLTLAAKDADLVRRAAQEHGLDLPVFDAIARRLAEGAKEHGEEDFSATYLTSTPTEH